MWRYSEGGIMDALQREIDQAIASFPPEFGLRSFPGARFRINPRACYYSDGYENEWGRQKPSVILYTQRLTSAGWVDFAKGTPAELHDELVALGGE